MDDEKGSRGIKPFDCLIEPATLGKRWKRWVTAFNFYADGKGLIIDNTITTEAHVSAQKVVKRRRRAQLLHLAGQQVQDIFETLSDKGADDDYDACVNALNSYFVPKVNTTYTRQLFHHAELETGETILQFSTRLRGLAVDCNFGADINNHIRDAILWKCKAPYMKRRLLELQLQEGDALTLTRTLEAAEQCERIDSQMKPEDEAVNKVSLARSKTSQKGGNKFEKTTQFAKSKRDNPPKGVCYRCGEKGHFGRDPKCPARGKECLKCHKPDHFSKMCRTKDVNCVQEAESGVQDDYAFTVNSNNTGKILVSVGDVPLNVLIDSGASTNVIDAKTWSDLKEKHVKCLFSTPKCDKKLYAYGQSEPLETRGTFRCVVSVNGRSCEANFVVIAGTGVPILGLETARELGVLKIDVNAVGLGTCESETECHGLSEKLQSEFKDVLTGVGKLRGKQIQLKTDSSVQPVAQPMRRTPFGLREKVELKLDELMSSDIIEPVEEPSEWVSPIVIVPKEKQNDIRMCIDMRRVNEAILRERHPIPTIDEMLQDMNGSKVFSKIDLKWGYHQLELHPDSRHLTTFVTHAGMFRFKRLVFGINTASEIFQNEIRKVVQGIPGVANKSDDVIVHTQTVSEHYDSLRKLFDRLRQAGLTVNWQKCELFKPELVFDGHLLSDRGIDPWSEKVKAVNEAREPENVSETRSFLGLVNFFCRFIPNLATTAEPLRKLTRKEEGFEFGPEQKEAFRKLKRCLVEAETLGFFDVNAKTQVIADASPYGLGAVLVQIQNNEPRVITYASRSLTPVERRYSQTEREALALVWACEKFHAYVYGLDFDLVTDHKPLQAIYSPKSKPPARIERWVLRLQPYRFRVVHVAGTKMIADPLSRLVKPDTTDETPVDRLGEEAESYVRFVATEATPKAVTTRQVEEASSDDPELAQVRKCIEMCDWASSSNTGYLAVKDELCTIGKLVMRGPKIVIPSSLRRSVIAVAHEGHMGMTGTKQRLRTKVWWPGLDKDVERYIRACKGCQLVAQPTPPEPVCSTELPPGKWQDLAVDLLGPMPTGESLLVVVDYYTRYYEVEITHSVTTKRIIELLDKMFAVHGLPYSIKSDNGPQFGAEFNAYLAENNIVHHSVTPLWAQANGEVERQNRSMLKCMKIAQAMGKNWRLELVKYLRSYRTTPHNTTGKPPAELLFSRSIRTKLPEVREQAVNDGDVRDRDAERKMKSKIYADVKRGAKPCDIRAGETVLVKQPKRNKLTSDFKPEPFKVVERKGNSVVIESPEQVRYRRNVTEVKKFVEPTAVNADVKPANVSADVNNAPPVEGGIEPTLPAPSSSVETCKPVERPTRARKAPERYGDWVSLVL